MFSTRIFMVSSLTFKSLIHFEFILVVSKDHLLAPYTRINSKWIKDLKDRAQTIKIVEENIGSKILDIAHSIILSAISPQARETKEKINKWDYIKLKTFCTAKVNINKIKTQPTE